MYTSFSVSLLCDSMAVKDGFYSSSHQTTELLAIYPNFICAVELMILLLGEKMITFSLKKLQMNFLMDSARYAGQKSGASQQLVSVVAISNPVHSFSLSLPSVFGKRRRRELSCSLPACTVQCELF